MKLDILVIICLPLYIFQCLALSSNNTDVYYQNSATGDLWRLVWADEFKDVSRHIPPWTHWTADHQIKQKGKNKDKVCSYTSRTENVRVEYGKLVLGTTQERYYHKNYTGAQVTSRRYFGNGRYEIRAALPVANFVSSSIFTWNDHVPYKSQIGQFQLLRNTQDEEINQSVRFVNRTRWDKLPSTTSDETIDFGMFHIYGVEWNATGVRMFFDNRYTVWTEFQEQQTMNPYHQIIFQIDVGTFDWDTDIIKEFKNFEWPCPAFVIDYVRVFEPVTRTPLEGMPIVDIIAAEQTAEEGEELVKICDRARKLASTSSGSTQLTSILIPSLSFFLIIFLATSGYLIYRLKKMKKTVKKTDSNGTITSKSLRGGIFVDGEMYEEIDYYNNTDKEETANVSQQAINNVYLELDATVPVTFGQYCATRQFGIDEKPKAAAQETDHEYLTLTDHGVR